MSREFSTRYPTTSAQQSGYFSNIVSGIWSLAQALSHLQIKQILVGGLLFSTRSALLHTVTTVTGDNTSADQTLAELNQNIFSLFSPAQQADNVLWLCHHYDDGVHERDPKIELQNLLQSEEMLEQFSQLAADETIAVEDYNPLAIAQQKNNVELAQLIIDITGNYFCRSTTTSSKFRSMKSFNVKQYNIADAMLKAGCEFTTYPQTDTTESFHAINNIDIFAALDFYNTSIASTVRVFERLVRHHDIHLANSIEQLDEIALEALKFNKLDALDTLIAHGINPTHVYVPQVKNFYDLLDWALTNHRTTGVKYLLQFIPNVSQLEKLQDFVERKNVHPQIRIEVEKWLDYCTNLQVNMMRGNENFTDDRFPTASKMLFHWDMIIQYYISRGLNDKASVAYHQAEQQLSTYPYSLYQLRYHKLRYDPLETTLEFAEKFSSHRYANKKFISWIERTRQTHVLRNPDLQLPDLLALPASIPIDERKINQLPQRFLEPESNLIGPELESFYLINSTRVNSAFKLLKSMQFSYEKKIYIDTLIELFSRIENHQLYFFDPQLAVLMIEQMKIAETHEDSLRYLKLAKLLDSKIDEYYYRGTDRQFLETIRKLLAYYPDEMQPYWNAFARNLSLDKVAALTYPKDRIGAGSNVNGLVVASPILIALGFYAFYQYRAQTLQRLTVHKMREALVKTPKSVQLPTVQPTHPKPPTLPKLPEHRFVGELLPAYFADESGSTLVLQIKLPLELDKSYFTDDKIQQYVPMYIPSNLKLNKPLIETVVNAVLAMKNHCDFTVTVAEKEGHCILRLEFQPVPSRLASDYQAFMNTFQSRLLETNTDFTVATKKWERISLALSVYQTALSTFESARNLLDPSHLYEYQQLLTRTMTLTNDSNRLIRNSASQIQKLREPLDIAILKLASFKLKLPALLTRYDIRLLDHIITIEQNRLATLLNFLTDVQQISTKFNSAHTTLSEQYNRKSEKFILHPLQNSCNSSNSMQIQAPASAKQQPTPLKPRHKHKQAAAHTPAASSFNTNTHDDDNDNSNSGTTNVSSQKHFLLSKSFTDQQSALIQYAYDNIVAIKNASAALNTVNIDDLKHRIQIYQLIDLYTQLHLATLAMIDARLITYNQLVKDIIIVQQALRRILTFYSDEIGNEALYTDIAGFTDELRTYLHLSLHNGLSQDRSNLSRLTKIALLKEETLACTLTAFSEDLTLLREYQQQEQDDILNHLPHNEQKQKDQMHLHRGFLIRIGTHVHKLQRDFAEFYGQFIDIKHHSTLKLNQITNAVSDNISITDLFQICLQVRNIRSHETNGTMHLPVFDSLSKAYVDSLDNTVVNALMRAVYRNLDPLIELIEYMQSIHEASASTSTTVKRTYSLN